MSLFARVSARPALLVQEGAHLTRFIGDTALNKPTTMPQRRTNKHISQKERAKDQTEKFVSRKNAQYLVNALIDQGSCTDLDRAVKILQKINDQLGKGAPVVVCCHCARKIGVKHCSGCLTTQKASYCSRECQAAAWPTHKDVCGMNTGIDVE